VSLWLFSSACSACPSIVHAGSWKICTQLRAVSAHNEYICDRFLKLHLRECFAANLGSTLITSFSLLGSWLHWTILGPLHGAAAFVVNHVFITYRLLFGAALLLGDIQICCHCHRVHIVRCFLGIGSVDNRINRVHVLCQLLVRVRIHVSASFWLSTRSHQMLWNRAEAVARRAQVFGNMPPL
jgi:hypothetical protein